MIGKKSFLIVLFLSITFLSGINDTHAALAKKVVGDLAFWDQARGYQSIKSNIDLYSEVSPFWYFISSTGRVSPYKGSTQSYEDQSIVDFLHTNGVLVIPTVTNLVNGVFDGALVSKIINNSSLRDTAINSLVHLTLKKGYDGIDLDFEDLAASDRTAFSAFVTKLASALHVKNKILAVDVYAKTSDLGTWNGPEAQDYVALGKAADEIRIMMYEYHWASSSAGAIAPIDWVNDTLNFAKTQIAPSKIIQGVPLYGYDWVEAVGTEHTWQETMDIASNYGATINWDETSLSPWISYKDSNGVQHTNWFENEASVDAKLNLTTNSDIGGVFLWRLGGEDPGVWQAIRNRLGIISANKTE